MTSSCSTGTTTARSSHDGHSAGITQDPCLLRPTCPPSMHTAAGRWIFTNSLVLGTMCRPSGLGGVATDERSRARTSNYHWRIDFYHVHG